MIALICPHCRQALSIPDAAAALPVVCTACAAPFAAGIPIAAPSAEWTAPPSEPESLPMHLRFQNRQRSATRGPGIFPLMAVLFAIFVPVALGAVLYTAMLPRPKAKATAPAPDDVEADPLNPSEAGERKPGGGPPVVEYKSMTEDPALIAQLRLETSVPSPKAEAAPPLFRGAKPLPKPRPQDSVWTSKPPP